MRISRWSDSWQGEFELTHRIWAADRSDSLAKFSPIRHFGIAESPKDFCAKLRHGAKHATFIASSYRLSQPIRRRARSTSAADGLTSYRSLSGKLRFVD